MCNKSDFVQEPKYPLGRLYSSQVNHHFFRSLRHGVPALAVVAALVILSTSAAIPAFASSAPVSSHPIIKIRNSTSSNWSGYAAESSIANPSSDYVSSVSGSWKVPSLTCTSGQATYVAVWVGIDGYSDNTVEQTGTEQQCSATGVQTFYAWYEMYPHPMFSLFSVLPGDVITASVTTGSGGAFTLTITDTTSGQSSTVTQRSHSASLQSAEWIVEAPYSGGVLPLADFSTVTFTGAQYTTTAGQTLAVNGAGYDPITMNDPANGATATPSTLSSSGTSFDVTYSGGSGGGGGGGGTGGSGSLSVALACDVSSCTYSTGSFAYITATVTSSSGAVSGASVTLTITSPNGGTASGSGTTGSNGQVTFKYRVSPHAALGTYSMVAVATSGSSSGTGSGSLTVN